MLHNIKFEINTSIISGKETLLRFLKDNPKKNTGIIIDKNLYRKSNYIKKCLIKAKKKKQIYLSFMIINLNHLTNI